VARSPADDLPPAVRAGYEVLRQRFLAGLPERWRRIEDAPDAGARIAELHRLAGVAGSYGCDGIGQAARAAEQLARAPGPALAAALAELHRRLQDSGMP
jgi:HPt (histidine-containing phosphotransfer) domain-containing protein